ncbi:MAG: hypothetical protein RL685_7660 [Pseudomonadota bacterium]|jgi:hypothetical protein
MGRALVALLIGLVLPCLPAVARAQSWVTDAQLSLASGLEGASGGGGVGWQRARTRLILGMDLGNDEHGVDAYGVRAFVELERSLSVGGEVGYLRWVLPELSLFVGGVAVLAPSTLFGVTAAGNYTFPLGKRLGLSILASFSALPLGNDRPDDGVVVWALLGLGIRGRL